MTRLSALIGALWLAISPVMPRTRLTPPAAISVALLYDATFSVTHDLPSSDGDVRHIIDSVIRDVHEGDVLRFGVIANRLYLTERLDATSVRSLASHVPDVADTDRFGPSPIWDALWTAVDLVAGDGLRPAIIVVTDGRSTGNVHGVDDVIRRAQSRRVPIFVVDLTLTSDARTAQKLGANPADTLTLIATSTGGRIVGRLSKSMSPALLISSLFDTVRQ